MGDGFDVLMQAMRKAGGQVRFELSNNLQPCDAEEIERDNRIVVLVGKRLWDYATSHAAYQRSTWEEWKGAHSDEATE